MALLSLIQRCFLTLPVMNSLEKEAGAREGAFKPIRKRRTDRASRSARDSTHYRMYAPRAIFDVAVERVQMKLLLPRGVDLARNARSELSERTLSLSLSPWLLRLAPPTLPLSIRPPNNVIITFNECYLSFRINKTHRACFSRATSPPPPPPPLTPLK